MLDRPRITHVIYDLDGLLLDTESINEAVNRAIVDRYGCVYDPAVRGQIAGRDAHTSSVILVESLGLPISPEAMLEQRRQLVAQWRPIAQPMPGAVELTQHLHRCGVPQAIATSSSRGPFAWKAAPHQAWFQIFECTVLSDDPGVRQAKPAPDLFLEAARRLGASPDRCLVFEDAPAGVAAARAAGMTVIAVPDPILERSALVGAAAILPSLADFDPVAWGLPDRSAAVLAC
ncbi:MAG: HAD family hydrolase [Oscillatoriales cyanobacterium]|nr:MAG: HAD family hydrolase [Oscillatoriales cyanobacterium]